MIIKKNKATVGISDDHPLLRETMKLCLETAGYNVILEAENGKELVEKIDPHQLPDICLLDINMPVMNGYETTTYLKKNWPTVKVLIYSMNKDSWASEKAFACGADGYLVKPSTIDELETAIDNIVESNAAKKS